MKSGVAIALVLGGVILICLPPLNDSLRLFAIAQLLQAPAGDRSMLNLINTSWSDAYRIGCFVGGALMIGAVVRSAWRNTVT